MNQSASRTNSPSPLIHGISSGLPKASEAFGVKINSILRQSGGDAAIYRLRFIIHARVIAAIALMFFGGVSVKYDPRNRTIIAEATLGSYIENSFPCVSSTQRRRQLRNNREKTRLRRNSLRKCMPYYAGRKVCNTSSRKRAGSSSPSLASSMMSLATVIVSRSSRSVRFNTCSVSSNASVRTFKFRREGVVVLKKETNGHSTILRCPSA
jgi:hypothetical protein